MTFGWIYWHKICRHYVIFFWLSFGWNIVGNFLTQDLPTLCHFFLTQGRCEKNEFMSSDVVSFFLTLSRYWKNDIMSVMMRKKLHNVGPASFHFFLNLCRLFKMTKWHKVVPILCHFVYLMSIFKKDFTSPRRFVILILTLSRYPKISDVF
jgi:hypothetical protein